MTRNMPEYFFHICLEVFSNHHNSFRDQSAPINLSLAFKALKPFLRSLRPHHAGDNKSGTHKTHSKPCLSAPSGRLFDRTVTEQVQPSAPSDHRLDHIQLECVDMEDSQDMRAGHPGDPQEKHIEKGLGTSISGAQTKGRYVTVRKDLAGVEWGIVHLYRDTSETPGLHKENQTYLLGSDIRNTGDSIPVPKSTPMTPLPPARDEDCTTLCILAVPSYLTPADFLAYVGEDTRQQVSHFRMIRTSRQNRYMVLMKFLNGKKARNWQAEWNGKVFNSMEPETVHVVFLKSVEIMQNPGIQAASGTATPESNGTSTFPRITNDPFAASPVPPTSKPLAPRTPSLVELPTCPVCLERMDETTGLLTILCQHVFHCTCLEKWSGGGCPVCRYTHDDFSTKAGGSSLKHKAKSKVDGFSADYNSSDGPLECEVCGADAALWQCLICGKVGCGRYDGKHAYRHFEETGHTFAMDLETKRVWDYAGDVYVHRIIQDAVKPGEKLVELPGRRRETTALENMDEDVETAKMENVALEYTHLLTSQLESQRVYFEEIVERAVDKATQASQKAEIAVEECDGMRSQFLKISHERDELQHKKVPELESERARLEKRAAKFEEMAKGVNSRYLEEKSLASSLMERIEHLENGKMKSLERRIQELEEDNATKDLLMEGLQEEHRDAMMQISAQEKLKQMVVDGELDPEDLIGATIEAGPTPIVRKGRRPVKKETNVSSHNSKVNPIPDDELSRELRSRLNLDAAQIEKGQAWDEEKAGLLFEEFRAKMLEAGLLKERDKQVPSEDHTEAEVDTGSAQGQPKTTAKKKKKGKGKKWTA